jgi:hypothetical protein
MRPHGFCTSAGGEATRILPADCIASRRLLTCVLVAGSPFSARYAHLQCTRVTK